MRRSTFVITVSAIALFTAGQALAQDATPLRLGQQVSGSLTAEDTRVDSEEMGQFVYDTYGLRLRQGQRLEAVMRAEGFDTYLEAYGPGSDEAFATDDDGLGEGTNSRLRFVADANGTYTIRARTLNGLDGGDYTLTVSDRGAAPRAPRPTGLRLDNPVSGEIADRDPTDENDAMYDAYSFRARSGQRFAISLASEAFDPIVRVGNMSRGGRFEELASNDDSGRGGLDSYLVFTAPGDGEFIVRAAPLDGQTTGDYTLTLAEAPPAMSTQAIEPGASIDGSLTTSDGSNDFGQRADGYTIHARTGQRIVATMTSDAFDTFLELYSENPQSDGGRYSVDSDDDGAGEGTNSRLSYTFYDDGDYTLEARAFGDDGTGDYTLTLEEAPPLPEPTELTYGTTVQGEIVDADPRDDDNRGFDAYTFAGEEGTRVQLIMRSGDFDTYLQIGSPDGEFYAIASDDDGLGEGTDSRLNYILPSTGNFIVRASPLSADSDGLYSLELLDKGPQPQNGSILVGATARGTLGEDDALAEDGSFYDAYDITLKAGEKLRLTMVSNEFDAFLDVGRIGEDGTFASVISDDDSLSDTHAKIEWSVEEDGDYVIRARSYAQDQEGAYALTVEPRE